MTTKAEANYTESASLERSCAGCKHFDGQSKCDVVEGPVDPMGVSDLFEPMQEQGVSPVG